MPRRQLPALLALLACTHPAAAGETWAGQRVVVKRFGVALGHTKDGQWRPLGTVKELAVSVLDEKGDWLLVRSDGRVGWMPKAEAVPAKAAVDFYTRLLDAEPNVESHRLRRASAYQECGRYGEAVRDFGEAIRLDPKSHVAFNGRAVARHLGRQYADALADYAEAVRLAPNEAHTHANRAWLQATCPDARFRDGKKAAAGARKACELTEWKDADCVENLAAALAEDGQFEEAVTYQKKALEFPRFENENGVKARERLKLYAARLPYRTEGGD